MADTHDWWRALAAYRREHPDWVPELDMDWDPKTRRPTNMAPNERGGIYAAIQAVLPKQEGGRGRRLTPDEKIKLDKMLDALGVSAR